MRYLLAVLMALAPLHAFGAVTDYWQFDDDAASTTVVATTGTNGATVSGNTADFQTSSGPGGDINYAFDLDGTADYVDISGSSIDFSNGTAFTISFWFNADSLSQFVIGRAGSQFRNIELVDSTHITIETSGTGDVSFAVPEMSTATWYHVFITRTATTNQVRLWLNGTESSSGAQAGTHNVTLDAIGRSQSNYFNGRITQVRFFDSDESANVATYYAEGVDSGSIIPLLHYYRQRMGR